MVHGAELHDAEASGIASYKGMELKRNGLMRATIEGFQAFYKLKDAARLLAVS